MTNWSCELMISTYKDNQLELCNVSLSMMTTFYFLNVELFNCNPPTLVSCTLSLNKHAKAGFYLEISS